MKKITFETWLIIPSYPNYIINEFGDIRRRKDHLPIKYHFLKGYKSVKLSSNGKKDNRFVHVLVAETFIGPRPKGYQSHHKDHNPLNNHYINLEYKSTYDHFNEHRETRQRHCVKLSPNKVIDIRAKYQTGNYTLKDLGFLFNVSYVAIHKIVKRKVWKHI